MNLNIVISFIIGGLLLLALLTLNARVLHSSGEAVLSMTAKQKVETINKIMRRDFTRLGFNVKGSGCGDSDDSPAIVEATNQKIVFCADIDTLESTKAKRVIWEFLSAKPYVTSENPNDFVLKRTGPISISSSGTSRFPVTSFSLSYLDQNGNTPTNEDKIKSITVSLEAQSPVKYGEDSYAKAFIKKTFVPPTLHLNAID